MQALAPLPGVGQRTSDGGLQGQRVLIVEAARGAAALYVCLFHFLYSYGRLHDSFRFGKYVFHPFNYGPEAVFLFFFLSGFSIHYSSQKRPLGTVQGILQYCYLRARRICPIFLIAVGLALGLANFDLLVTPHPWLSRMPTLQELWYVVFFLSDIHIGSWSPSLVNNQPLWSLSYEMVYYLVYPLFWIGYKKIGKASVLSIVMLLSCLSILITTMHPNHIANVFSLYWVWACGAVMADWKISGRKFNCTPGAYYLLLFATIVVSQVLEGSAAPFVGASLNSLVVGAVIFSFFCNFERQSRFWARAVDAAKILALCLVVLVTTRNVPTTGGHWFLDLRLAASGLGLALFTLCEWDLSALCRLIVKPFLSIGSYSYAIYVIHAPIMISVITSVRVTNVSVFYFFLVFLVIFPLAWFLEIKFQPLAAKWMDVCWQRSKNMFLRPA